MSVQDENVDLTVELDKNAAVATVTETMGTFERQSKQLHIDHLESVVLGDVDSTSEYDLDQALVEDLE